MRSGSSTICAASMRARDRIRRSRTRSLAWWGESTHRHGWRRGSLYRELGLRGKSERSDRRADGRRLSGAELRVPERYLLRPRGARSHAKSASPKTVGSPGVLWYRAVLSLMATKAQAHKAQQQWEANPPDGELSHTAPLRSRRTRLGQTRADDPTPRCIPIITSRSRGRCTQYRRSTYTNTCVFAPTRSSSRSTSAPSSSRCTRENHREAAPRTPGIIP
jgi:hypothetical protein